MARILVVFASIDGQAARIAARMAGTLEAQGHAVSMHAAADPGLREALANHDAVIVGGAIRHGRYVGGLEALVQGAAPRLGALPNAFFSVCLSAGGPGARPAQAARYVAKLIARTGWQPQRTASFAGALLYTKYGFLIRVMMRMIVGIAGGDTDASRDYEYTDWQAVEGFAQEFAARLGPLAAAATR